jgi:hypothetical protein
MASGQRGLQPYAYAVVGGLLSSSCCVIQLALNAMSVGCAGFSVLTPYRPSLIAVTALGLAYSHQKYAFLAPIVFREEFDFAGTSW